LAEVQVNIDLTVAFTVQLMPHQDIPVCFFMPSVVGAPNFVESEMNSQEPVENQNNRSQKVRPSQHFSYQFPFIPAACIEQGKI
jgi:hypothetical protein